MDKPAEPQNREERLAARLRENLHRRKQQARSLAGDKPRRQPEEPPAPA